MIGMCWCIKRHGYDIKHKGALSIHIYIVGLVDYFEGDSSFVLNKCFKSAIISLATKILATRGTWCDDILQNRRQTINSTTIRR